MPCATARKARTALACSINTTLSKGRSEMPNALPPVIEPVDFRTRTLESATKDGPGGEPVSAPLLAGAAPKTTPLQIILIVLATIAFLYFARPVVLPIFLAGMTAMTLKPLIRWSSCCHIPPALSAAVVLGLLVFVLGIGFFQLGR